MQASAEVFVTVAVRCPRCGIDLNDEEQATAVQLQLEEIIDLGDYVGWTLRTVNDSLASESPRVALALCVRNDGWKNPRAKETSRRDGWRSIDDNRLLVRTAPPTTGTTTDETANSDDWWRNLGDESGTCLPLPAGAGKAARDQVHAWVSDDGYPPITADYVVKAGDQGLRYTFGAYHPVCAEQRLEASRLPVREALQMRIATALGKARFKGVEIDHVDAPHAFLSLLFPDAQERPDAATFGRTAYYYAVRVQGGDFGLCCDGDDSDAIYVDLTGSGLHRTELLDLTGKESPVVVLSGTLLTNLRLLLERKPRKKARKR